MARQKPDDEMEFGSDSFLDVVANIVGILIILVMVVGMRAQNPIVQASVPTTAELESLNDWVEGQGLPRGQIGFDHADPATGAQKALFDLAWPEGLQAGLSAPVAVLLNESADILALASGAGFRCFTSSADFRAYVETEILHLEAA